MRRSLLMLLASIVIGLALLTSWSRAALAQSYGPDLAGTATAYSCGDGSGHADTLAFDDNVNTYWASSQTGTNVAGHACIGQNFGASSHHIRRVGIQQSASTTAVSSVIVQNSSDGTNWNTVDTLNNLPADASMHYYAVAASASYPYWRLLANSATSSAGAWAQLEMEMMEALTWPTDTPGPSSTPTITLTPSTTPSPTPDYFVEVISTQGSPMRFERSADAGELFILVGLMLNGGLGLIAFSIWFWQRRPDGS